MKISKVDHKRTAVSVRTKTIKGVLYDNPAGGKNPIKNIGQQYDALSKRAEGLYSILNPAKGKEKEEVRNFRKSINHLTRKLLEKCVGCESERIIKEQMRMLNSNAMRSYIPTEGELYDDQVERLIGEYLKRSLRKNIQVNGQLYYIPELFTDYLKRLKNLPGTADSKLFGSIIESVGREKIEAMLEAFNKDFQKPNRRGNTIKSIEQQTVPVKVTQKDGRYYLVPSNAEHPKKKYIFEFMREYAGSTGEGKRDILIRMRKLLVLYLHGKESIEDISVNEKSFCGELSLEEFIAPELKSSFEKKYTLEMDILDLTEELQLLAKKKFLSDEERKNRGRKKAKKAASEAEVNKEKAFISSKIDEALAVNFRAAVSGHTITDADKFWIDYFDGEARKILLKGHRLDNYKLSTLWLGKRIWNNWTAYVAEKYIDYGKAVYHFVMPELLGTDMSSVSFGEVQPEYQEGISSFEYERVKAKENLDRSTAVAITSAVNTFSRAVLERTPVIYNEKNKQGEEANDILFVKRDDYSSALYPDAGKRILRYFGGFSNWSDSEDIQFYAEDDRGIELVEAVKQQLADVRNNSFHYTGSEGAADSEIIRELFNHEEKNLSAVIRQKYYSNNVFRYYGQQETKDLLDYLYKEPAYVPSQVPSFGRLFNRNSAYAHEKMLMGKGRQRIAGKGPEEVEIFKGSFLFLLKEIYYNAFLQDKACKECFMRLVFDGNEHIKVQNEEALKDFRARIKSMGENVSIGEICQQIMTDYELQNQNKRVHKSGKNEKEVYKHFRTLLYIYLREAFVDYLLHSEYANVFRFVRNPSLNEAAAAIKKEGYLNDWTCSTFAGIIRDERTFKWYTLAHFLDPKQLNHLIGALKSYEVYIKDIERRAADTGNRHSQAKTAEECVRIREIIETLVFTMNFCAKTTNNIGDYFFNDEEYAAALSDFVDIRNKYVSEWSTALKIFCDNKASVESVINGKKNRKEVQLGIYHDGTNPIPNRNVFMASMYGDMKLLSAVCDKVKDSDIREYYRKQAELVEVFKRGKCITAEEQQKLREFQNKKNYIELNDLISYAEMVNDLNGQLVNWSYFRERDLMYMQLGIHYIRLFFTDSIPYGDRKRTIAGEGFEIKDGALLYQIVAMYTYGLPLYGFDKSGNCKIIVKAGVSSGGCIGAFIKGYCGESFGDPLTYNEGLYFFERLEDHAGIIETRNYIDHFKYYTGQKRSLLDLYSEIYERFFTYSVNFKKSVSFILPNILERYFVILRTEIKKDYRDGHPAATICVTGVSSAKLTYKIAKAAGEPETEVLVPARTDKYLATVKRLLAYKAD